MEQLRAIAEGIKSCNYDVPGLVDPLAPLGFKFGVLAPTQKTLCGMSYLNRQSALRIKDSSNILFLLMNNCHQRINIAMIQK